jgi:hypothetical protein
VVDRNPVTAPRSAADVTNAFAENVGMRRRLIENYRHQIGSGRHDER